MKTPEKRKLRPGHAALLTAAALCSAGCGLLTVPRPPQPTLSAPGVRCVVTQKPDDPYISGISWSPDGTMLAFDGETSLTILDVATGSTIIALDIDYTYAAAWSPDGSVIAFKWGGGVYTVDTAVALEGE